MTQGPWDAGPSEPPPRSRAWLVWLLLMAAVGGLVLALFKAFPEAIRTGNDWSRLGYALGLVVLVSAGLTRVRRDMLGQHVRHAALWAVIAAVLALGVAYKDELAGVPQHLRLAFSDGTPVATGEHELVVPQDEEGSFSLIGKVNGQRVRFVVDTGATDTVLSPADARMLGIDVDKLRYEYEAETANGTGYGAAYVADRLEVGPIALKDFRMTVNKAPLSSSLLGVSFLSKLDSFEIRGRKLIIRWHDAA